MKGILGLNRLSFRSFSVLAIVLVVASCVPQRKRTYLAPLPKGNEVQEATMAVYPDYRFQPNDIINVQVKTLNPEIDQFYNTISKVLLKQFVEGTVFVKVQLTGIRYTVVGECFRPGAHYLYQNQATLLDALANAGDITMLGDRKRVQVTRLSEGKWKTFVVDLTQRETLNRPEFILQPNDLIQVRPLPQKSAGVGQTGFGTFSSLVGVLSSSIALYLALTR
jgi:polysaccharide export outer membrane protein